MMGFEIIALLPFLKPSSRRGGGGFIRSMIRWFIMVAIYDICIGGIAELLGVSRMIACLIFIAGLLAVSAVGYLVKERVSPGIDD
ncbi:MAG: hypothetical protein V3V20_09415 [Algisphaera sp.]